MACVLTARGRTFDVEKFLRDSNLRPRKVWKRGEVIPSPAGEDRKEGLSGLNVVVSSYGRDNFADQLRDAKRFLRRNKAELRRLQRSRGLDDVWIEFGVLLREDVAIHTDALPADVVEAAGEIPLTLSISHYRV